LRRFSKGARRFTAMADIHKFSEHVIDYAERLSNMADAASGKRMSSRNGGFRGLVLLPAVGAGIYALLRSDFFTRQAKGVVDEAKTVASDLPNDLMKSVRRPTSKGSDTSGTASSTRSQTQQKPRSRQRRSQKSSSRRTNSAKANSGR
jgi:hypothetical protein